MAKDRPQSDSGPLADSEPGGRRESVGEYLATQRRLRGISLDELCERTKIPRRNLERLESGAFDARPDGFARGFVRAVALDLGLDADEAVMRLVGEPSPDEFGRGAGALSRWLLRGAAIASVVLFAVLLTKFVIWASSVDENELATPNDPTVTYRHDVVRSLAADPPPAQVSKSAADPALAGNAADANATSDEPKAAQSETPSGTAATPTPAAEVTVKPSREAASPRSATAATTPPAEGPSSTAPAASAAPR